MRLVPRIAGLVLVVGPLAILPGAAALWSPPPLSRQAQQVAQASEVDRQFAELTKPARLSEETKLTAAREQFLRDHPDYPALDRLYVRLLLTLTRSKSDPERLRALADEALSKFPERSEAARRSPNVRATAYSAKFSLVEPGSEASRTIGRQVLETEHDPLVLTNAAHADKADALPLLERAIAERRKLAEAPGQPALDELEWSYVRTLLAAGRLDEAVKLSAEVIEETARALAKLEAPPGGRPAVRTVDDAAAIVKAQGLRETLAERCGELAGAAIDAGRPTVARETLDRHVDVFVALESRPTLQTSAADLYEKAGRRDLALDVLTRALTVRMDPATRDKIVTLAGKMGKRADDVFARARQIRERNAAPVYPFVLTGDDGKTVKLADLQSRAILVNFFNPT